MPKLTEVKRQQVKNEITEELKRLVGNTPRGFTLDELQECWEDALASWFSFTKERG